MPGKEPLVNVLPYKLKSAALITTGGEVAKGLIRDTFSDVVIEKLKAYGIETVEHCYPGDDEALITEKIAEYKAKGVDMILCTGGMSVDPGRPHAGSQLNVRERRLSPTVRRCCRELCFCSDILRTERRSWDCRAA